MEAMRNAYDYKIFVGTFEEKKSLGRRCSKQKNDIKSDLKETGFEVEERIHMARGRV
jgi:hypothetical protein